ncbi:hypothetical protein PENANT_c043G03981 [Penicillium antarcticum]|uniref:Major facilitator superfamily (MFS) profile domain-containing protein n=1 Tax=Penicillium antarcticum TaxID=416450 RepID=A0A1V6PS85_9EURO|nr:hypothetical protein PENANT_c043G03981 [Penicillium antarcticum]
MGHSNQEPSHYPWRSSKWLIVSTISIAVFADTFLYAFLVPILGYIFENRLQVNPSQTQTFTSGILAIHGLCSAISGPVIGHFADKSVSRKSLLLLALVGCILGTALIACAHSLYLLFLGRVVQGIAGSLVWIVGFATVAETVGDDSIGAVMGVVTSFAHAGIISGPMISGFLFGLAGYWAAWSVPLAVLIVDVIARLIMVERPHEPQPEPSSETSETESTSLLESSRRSHDATTTLGFYGILLSSGRVVTALLVSVSIVSLNTGFDATLPLHIRHAFGWGTSATGLLFFCLSIPAVVLTPIAGWLRDRIGTRIPATIAFLVQAVVMALHGIAGTDYFAWSSAETGGRVFFRASILAIGMLQPFILGVAPIELTAFVKEKQELTPGIFGPRGGLSRTFSMTEVAATLGMIIGPVLSGSLTELVGYSYMSWTWSVLSIILACLAFMSLLS